MLFRKDVLRGIAEGRVTLAFRRWRRPPPAEGSLLRTPVGVLRLERIQVVDMEDITPADVAQTGMRVDDLRASLDGPGVLFRVVITRMGDDPRVALRQTRPSDEDLEALVARLTRLDQAAPWTLDYLRLIAARPAVAARHLALDVGADLVPFKRRIRQLKELGLTESLEVGYRLSPRGKDLLERLEANADPPFAR